MKKKQSTLTDNTDVKISNKNGIKRGSIKFHPTKSQTFEGIMEELEVKHKRTKFYSLFSGGKDSMTVAHKLSEMGKLEKIIHIKTNIGLQMTTDFVIDICKEYNWPLQIIEPSPKYTYAAHILQYGFPGPAYHRLIMGKLKFKTMRDFAYSADRKNHCLISGVRKFESSRRQANYPHPILNESDLWFCSPAFYLTNEETYKYVHENGLKISPAYKMGLGTSGECECGAYATHGEKELIRKLDPKLADYIKWLEEGIEKFGTVKAKRFSKWGSSMKISEMEQQSQIDEFVKENPSLGNLDELEAITCGAECGAGSLKGMEDY